MRRSAVKLKAASGWFAAGVEMQRAATVLPDNAFKVYVWLCLHAERDRGACNSIRRTWQRTSTRLKTRSAPACWNSTALVCATVIPRISFASLIRSGHIHGPTNPGRMSIKLSSTSVK